MSTSKVYKVQLQGLSKRGVDQLASMEFNLNTNRDCVFDMNSTVDTISRLIVLDDTGKEVRVIEPIDVSKGLFSDYDVKVHIYDREKVDGTPYKFHDRRQDLDELITRVLHDLDASFPSWKERDWWEVSDDTRDAVVGLHLMGKSIDQICANKKVTVKRETVEKIVKEASKTK